MRLRREPLLQRPAVLPEVLSSDSIIHFPNCFHLGIYKFCWNTSGITVFLSSQLKVFRRTPRRLPTRSPVPHPYPLQGHSRFLCVLKAGGAPRNTQLLASQQPGLVSRGKALGLRLLSVHSAYFFFFTNNSAKVKKKKNKQPAARSQLYDVSKVIKLTDRKQKGDC